MLNTKIATDIQESTNFHTDIFIPKHFLEHNNNTDIDGVLLCICKTNTIRLESKINAIFLLHDLSLNELARLLENAKTILQNELGLSLCLGFMNNLNATFILKSYPDLNHFYIKSSKEIGSELYVSKVINLNTPNGAKHSVTLITYNCHPILDCDALDTDETNPKLERMIDFINYTLTMSKKLDIGVFNNCNKNSVIKCVPNSNSRVGALLIAVLLAVLNPLNKLSYEKMYKGLRFTATGRQLTRKLSDIKTLCGYLKEDKISLKCGNLLAAIIADIAFGVVLTFILRDYLNPEEIFASILEMTETVVNELQTLINWLMGVPAGLKLNRPLNIVLGRFFLYHIYLWKTYIVVLKPFLLIALENSTIVGIFGVTFLLSFASDFISLATIHIYCFYGYAARLYNLNITGLIALWRLFCGKKRNPLRNRVDSYTYDVQQLFIGTLMFTVLIFLLPTVVVYYAVFTMLRLAVLFFLLGIAKMVKMINSMPIYVLLLRIACHTAIRGEIYFEVVSNVEDTVHLRMTPKPSSWVTLWCKTQPNTKFDETNLTWKELVFNLFRGNIIYPL